MCVLTLLTIENGKHIEWLIDRGSAAALAIVFKKRIQYITQNIEHTRYTFRNTVTRNNTDVKLKSLEKSVHSLTDYRVLLILIFYNSKYWLLKLRMLLQQYSSSHPYDLQFRPHRAVINGGMQEKTPYFDQVLLHLRKLSTFLPKSRYFLEK